MTGNDLVAGTIRRAGDWADAQDRVALDYDGRFIKRRRLTTQGGRSVMVDLPRTTSLEPGDALELSDGSLLEIIAADEDLAEISTGADPHNLLRLVWHIGNRHTPCQIEATRCLIRRDAVLENMLRGLGATVSAVSEAFHPEGGAYGQGRTLGHSHETGGALDSMHDHHHWAVHHHGSHGRPDGDDSPETEP